MEKCSSGSRSEISFVENDVSGGIEIITYGSGAEIRSFEDRGRDVSLETMITSDVSRSDVEGNAKSYPSIISGSFHQGDSRFRDHSRGKQCTANAAAALAMCKIADPSTWTTAHVDEILMAGDELYVDSIRARGDVHPGEQNTEYLTATELNTEINISSQTFDVLLKPEWICGHLSQDFPEHGFPNLKNRLQDFLATEKFGILTCNLISVAVFKTGDKVWIFDSHSRDSAGRVTPDGRACLMGFPNVESLFNVLQANIPPGNPSDNSSDYYDITEVNMVSRCDRQELFAEEEVSSSPLSIAQTECDADQDGCLEVLLPDHSPTEDRNIESEITRILEEERSIEEHALEVSNEALQEGLQDINTLGRGLFSFLHVWNQLHESFDEHDKGVECYFRNLRLVGYQRRGLKTLLQFKCSMCGYEKCIASEPEDDNQLDVNKSAVLGSVCAGIGHTQLEQLLGAMDVKCMPAAAFRREHDTVYDGIAETAALEMKLAGEEERELAIQRNDVINGIPHIPVAADGSWMKRSYKLGKYDSPSGLGAIIGYHTQKVLFIGVRNKFCSICDPALKKGETPREHVCYKNWGRNASSTSMESDAILEGFKSSIDQHGLIYSVLIGDGDSSTHKKIVDNNPYRDHGVYVKKVECGNHLIRNVGSKVKELAKRKGIPGPMRNRITNSVPRFNVGIRKAVQYRLQQDTTSAEKNKMLKADILNIPSHVFGEHGKCASIGYFCNGVPKPNEENHVPELRRLGIFDALEDTVSRLSHHTESLLYSVNNNTVESYNGVVAKFIGGKRINYGKKNSYNARSLGAAVQFNSKKVLTRFREVMGKVPSEVASKMEANRERWADLQKKRIARAKQNNVAKRAESKTESKQQTVDKDYGPRSEQPDLTPEAYVAELERHTARLQALQDTRISLERETVGQGNNPRWLSARQMLLTASKFGKVCLMKKTTSCKSTVQSILYSSNLRNVPAVDYGRKNEPIARLELETQKISRCETAVCSLTKKFLDWALRLTVL